MTTDIIPAFKGFNQDMTCRGFQYVEGETYTHEGRVKACYSGAAIASGEHSVAMASGRFGRARGKVGTWLVLFERERTGRILDGRTFPVDGELIREDVFHTLRDGKVVEA